jgi:hypothetical protein
VPAYQKLEQVVSVEPYVYVPELLKDSGQTEELVLIENFNRFFVTKR